MTERLDERLARLELERQQADRRYNDALTALDRGLRARPQFPSPPPAYDATKLPEINARWNILPDGPPVVDRSLKGRLRGFVWRLVGPPIGAQQTFNAAVVDHLNRNAAAHEQTAEATRQLIAVVAQHVDDQMHFQALLVQLLQTVTLYVDTKDRSTAGGQDVLNAALSAITDTWLKRSESLNAREERIAKRLASLEDLRVSTSLAQQTALSLKREVERLLSRESAAKDASNRVLGEGQAVKDAGSPRLDADAQSPTADLDAFKYLGFEDQFRGSLEDIRQRLAEYVPLFDGTSDVLDVGCGRGEFLELLRARGISGRGLDINQAMVEASRNRGLDVTKGDALDYLTHLADASLGGLFAAQVVEHLAPEYLAKLLEVAAHKMRPGGVIVLETINPACWLAFFESYIRDLTHVRPLHPETLQYLVRVSGFGNVSVTYKAPVPEVARLQPASPPPAGTPLALLDLAETFNENVAKLNSRLFSFQDYAVIGRK